jgi:hypothetical protein
MTDYMFAAVLADPAAAEELLSSDALAASAEIPEDVPPILQEELTWPYFAGMEFVNLLRDEGGWEAVNAAYAIESANVVQSSEQIIHVDRYLAGDVPVSVAILPALDALDGAGWALRQYLGTQLDSDMVDEAATGWGGDRYTLYYNEAADERAFILRLMWDTADDAAELEFAAAYREFVGERMENNLQAINGAECWANDERGDALCLLATGGETLIGYAPTIEEAARLIQAQS